MIDLKERGIVIMKEMIEIEIKIEIKQMNGMKAAAIESVKEIENKELLTISEIKTTKNWTSTNNSLKMKIA